MVNVTIDNTPNSSRPTWTIQTIPTTSLSLPPSFAPSLPLSLSLSLSLSLNYGLASIV